METRARIRAATTAEDFARFAALVTEYVDWCRVRYRDHPWFVERVFGHQSLDAELASLRESYSPPRGTALLCERDGEVLGAGAYRRRPDGSCEMKRMFVPARHRGQGLGRRLCEALIAAARHDGYARMRLDTAALFTEAIALYEALGFRRCDPYLAYPPELLPHLVFMERPLA